MASLRTQEEIQAIVNRCVEIEGEGGDVLAYLASEHYETPEATWHNFQKYYLRREKIMSGRPNKVNMGTRELIRKVIENDDGDRGMQRYLYGLGYTDPASKWAALKVWARKNDPGLYGRMPETLMRRKEKKRVPPSMNLKPPKTPETQAAEVVPVPAVAV